jgi:hypothetical protein
LDYLPEEELEIVLFLRRLCWNVCCKRLAYNVPFITAIPRFVTFGLLPFLGEVSNGVGIGFCKSASLLDETFETISFSSKSLFSLTRLMWIL